MKNILLCLFVLVSLVACNKATDSDSDDTSNTDLATATAEISDVAGAGDTGGSRWLGETLDEINRTSCSGISFGSCSSDVRERNFSDTSDGYCTRGSANVWRVFGKAILTYANVSSCDFNGTGGDDMNPPTVTRTVSEHYHQRSTGSRKLLVYTGTGTVAGMTIGEADLKDFEGNSRSGGAVLKKLTTGKKLTINGIHRRGLNAAGKYTLWHTLYSDADGITVTDGSGDDRILNGTMYLMHNRAQRKITKTMTNVKFTNSCRFPVSGTTTLSWSGGTDITIQWSSCNSATIDGEETTLDGNSGR